MKKQIKINSHNDRTSPKTNADYTVFKTDQGTMSVFEADIITKLKDAESKDEFVWVAVEKSADGKFMNIRGLAEPDEDEKEPEVVKVDTERKPVKNTAYEKDPVGLAVEVYCSMNTKDMTIAIERVKQAQKAFS